MINQQIADYIRELGHKPMRLHSLASCVAFGKRLFLEGDEGRRIDIGYVGEVEWINADLLNAVTEAGYIPVIAPIARDDERERRGEATRA